MATKFIFPKSPRVGDRLEITSISSTKLPINIVGNSESGKNLELIFPEQTFSAVADGQTVVATITEKNIVYTFKCVRAKDKHIWLLEGTCLLSKIKALETRLATLEAQINSGAA